LQLSLWCLTKICKRGKIYSFAQNKQASVIAGWIDFFNDIYMSMCIAFLINTSTPTMNNASEIGNNTFALVMGTALVLVPVTLACMFNKAYKANLSNSIPLPFPNISEKFEPEPNFISESAAVLEPASASVPGHRIPMAEGGEFEEEPSNTTPSK
jgi:hypothetical protein